MPYYKLTPEQTKALLDYIKGDDVYELGAGDLSLAKLMATSARRVNAIDKEHPAPKALQGLPKNVTFHRTTFQEMKFPVYVDCVVVCWPVTYAIKGLAELLSRALRVVYIGSNTGGCACGSHDLWLNLTKRMLVREVRDEHNCLHCYSVRSHEDPQFRSEEEVAGLLNKHGRFRIIGYNHLLVGDLSQETIAPNLTVAEVGDSFPVPQNVA